MGSPMTPSCSWNWRESTPKMLAHGRTGLLIEPGNPASLAGAIVRMAKDRTLRERFGKAAREDVLIRLSEERVSQQFAEIYEAMAQGRPLPKQNALSTPQ